MKKLRHALIMAAGRGTRMGAITNVIPKPMAKYGEYTLIEGGIRKIRPHMEYIHITVGYKGAILAEHVIGLGVDSVFNTEGRGNSWWLYNTLIRNLDEPVVVLTADNVTDLDFVLLEQEYNRLGSPASMVVPVSPVPGLDGDYIHHQNNVVNEINRKKVSPIYCSGIQIVNPFVINGTTNPVEDFYGVWQQLIEQRQLMCSNVYPLNWFTVDTVEQLSRLNRQTP